MMEMRGRGPRKEPISSSEHEVGSTDGLPARHSQDQEIPITDLESEKRTPLRSQPAPDQQRALREHPPEGGTPQATVTSPPGHFSKAVAPRFLWHREGILRTGPIRTKAVVTAPKCLKARCGLRCRSWNFHA
jgi:hypothetical protein